MDKPFISLGSKLKLYRESAKLSLMEVSGAIEIDVEELKKIEDGQNRPPEDIMFLLISYLNVKEDDADRLWELAGYISPKNLGQSSNPSRQEGQQIQIIVPMPEMRTIYSDMVNVQANKAGVTITFMQSVGKTPQPMAISRVGMSIEQATAFIQALTESVKKIQENKFPKSLNQPKDKEQNS